MKFSPPQKPKLKLVISPYLFTFLGIYLAYFIQVAFDLKRMINPLGEAIFIALIVGTCHLVAYYTYYFDRKRHARVWAQLRGKRPTGGENEFIKIYKKWNDNYLKISIALGILITIIFLIGS